MTLNHIVMAACAAALLTACGGGDDAAPVVPPVTEAVPAAAATSPAAAAEYVAELSGVAAEQSDTLEPVSLLPDTLATDDTAEPRAVD